LDEASETPFDFLAIGARNIYARMLRLHPEPDEAARVSGASVLTAAFMFDMSKGGTISDLAAVGLVTLGFLIVLVTVFQVLARRYGLRGF
jgi:hypothetical protein